MINEEALKFIEKKNIHTSCDLGVYFYKKKQSVQIKTNLMQPRMFSYILTEAYIGSNDLSGTNRSPKFVEYLFSNLKLYPTLKISSFLRFV